jgi:hypothetical protein
MGSSSGEPIAVRIPFSGPPPIDSRPADHVTILEEIDDQFQSGVLARAPRSTRRN